MIQVPTAFAVATCHREGEAGRRWVAGLPDRVDRLVRSWRLRVDGAVLHGFVALVVPVLRQDGRPAALKVSWVDLETEHEALALSWWAGRGAVGLLESAPQEGALLLERLDAHRSLHQLPERQAVEAAADVLRRLHVPPPEGLVQVAATARRWQEELPRRWESAGRPQPPAGRAAAGAPAGGLVERAAALCGELASAPGGAHLLHGDFHYANVLAAPGVGAQAGPDAGAWSAIDPKPVAGDREFDLLPLLRNRFTELVTTGDPVRAVRDRLAVLVDRSGLDPARARAWCSVRAVDDALWATEHQDGAFAATAWTIAAALG